MSKLETISNNKNSNDQNKSSVTWYHGRSVDSNILKFEFRICFGFLISCFEFNSFCYSFPKGATSSEPSLGKSLDF